MKHLSRVLVPALLGLSMTMAGAEGATGTYNIAAEIGGPLSALDAKRAEVVLNWYVEGKILTFAPKGPRVELLEAVVAVLPKGQTSHQRAELLLASARTSSWPDH